MGGCGVECGQLLMLCGIYSEWCSVECRVSDVLCCVDCISPYKCVHLGVPQDQLKLISTELSTNFGKLFMLFLRLTFF